MVLSALADEHLQRYIQNVSKYEPCAVGLILGQVNRLQQLSICHH